MQRNILKIALAYGVAFLLATAPIINISAAETILDMDTQNNNASELRETYYVNAQSGLKMRSAPSKDSDVITLLPYKTEVTVIETSDNDWYKIEYLNESGYVSASYLTKVSETIEDNDASSDAAEVDESESILSTEHTLENVSGTIGATPVIIALIVAIIIMILLAIFTAYSFLKKGKDNYDEYDDDYDDDYYDDYDDNDNDYNDDYDDNANGYSDNEYDEEYYDDEE